MSPTKSDREGSTSVELGVLIKPHGIQGLVKVRLHNPTSTALERCRQVTLLLPSGDRRRVGVEARASTKGLVLLQIDGVDGRDQAELLRGSKVLVEREALEPAEEGQYYYADLSGCQVVDEEGRPLGTVHGLFEAGASDVLVVRDGRIERYLPLVEEWVVVDLNLRRITVRGDPRQWEAWETSP